MSVEILLQFETITCQGCGADRVRGQVCPDCSSLADPREIDQQLVARKIPASRLKRHLSVGADDALVPSSIVTREDLRDWINEALAALSKFSTNPIGAEGRVSEVVSKFLCLERQHQRSVGLRPDLAEHASLSAVLGAYRAALGEYLESFVTALPVEAQRHGSQGQAYLDEAGAVLDSIEERAAVFQPLNTAESVGELEVAVVASTFMLWSASSGLELRELAVERLRELVGDAGAELMAIDYAFNRTLAEFTLNTTRFDDVIAALHRLLATGGSAVIGLLDDPLYRADVDDRFVDLVSSLYSIRLVALQSDDLRLVADQIVSLLGKVYEGAGDLIATTALVAAGIKSRPYAKLRHDNAGDLIDRAASGANFEWLSEGLDPTVRTAWAHSRVRHASRSVVFERSGQVLELSHEQLIDRALAAVELGLAGFVVIRCHLEARGHSNAHWSPNPEQSVEEWVELQARTWVPPAASVTVSRDEDDVLEVSLAGEVTEDRAKVAFALASDSRVGDVLRVIFVAFSETFDVSTRYRRAWLTENHVTTRMIFYLREQACSLLNGEPVLPQSAFRRAVSRAAIQALSREGLRAQLGELRAIRNAIATAGDPELYGAIRALAGRARAEALGFADSASPEVNRLRAWAELDELVDLRLKPQSDFGATGLSTRF